MTSVCLWACLLKKKTKEEVADYVRERKNVNCLHKSLFESKKMFDFFRLFAPLSNVTLGSYRTKIFKDLQLALLL